MTTIILWLLIGIAAIALFGVLITVASEPFPDCYDPECFMCSRADCRDCEKGDKEKL